MVVLQNWFHKLKLRSGYRFQDEPLILRKVEKGSWFPTRTKFLKRPEISIEHITENLLWAQWLGVLFFGDSATFTDAREDLRRIIEKLAGFHYIGSFCSVRCDLVFTLDSIIFVCQMHKWDVECCINRLFDAKHYVKHYVEWLMTRMHQVLSRLCFAHS